MPLIPPAPVDLRDTRIFIHLKEISTPDDGIAERAERFLEVATPLVDLAIAGPFKHFTLHNRDHAKKVLHLSGCIVAPETLKTFSGIECLILIYSAFLHDMGMALTSTERERVLQSKEFQDSVREWTELSDALQKARETHASASDAEKLPLETEIYQLQEAALCRFLRPRHATTQRYNELIALLKRKSGRNDLFELRGVSFESILIEICESHNLDVGVLGEIRGPYEDRFPRNAPIGGQHLNAQFCSALLRLADILDFDRERTPPILFESLGIESRIIPGADVTLEEWQKHLAVHAIEIEQDDIVVSAECRHPVMERTIRDFCHLIEREIRDTNAVIQRNKTQITDKYWLELPISVRSQIKSVGYIFTDMSLRLNESAIMKLLMGERLYSNYAVALRELIQNAVDACEARRVLEKNVKYSQSVTVSHSFDDAGRCWYEVADNGIGMDEHVLSEYFLSVGTSYYDSPEFNRLKQTGGDQPFVPIARFGVGVLSVFMIADALEVITKNPFSPRGDFKTRSIRVERMGRLAFVREVTDDISGSKVRIRIKKEFQPHLDELTQLVANYLQEVVLKPSTQIPVSLPNRSFILGAYKLFSLRPDARVTLDNHGLELVILDLERWSNQLSGPVAMLFAKRKDGLLSYKKNDEPLRFVTPGLDPSSLLDGYNGNVITVNGFKMALRKAAKIFSLDRKRQIAMAFDINVTGSKDLTYKIARDRIDGAGAIYLKAILRRTLVSGVKELDLFDKLDTETQALMTSLWPTELESTTAQLNLAQPKKKIRSILTEETLEAVKAKLPKDQWPKGIHVVIAAELGLSNGTVSDAITVLVSQKRVQNPNPPREFRLSNDGSLRAPDTIVSHPK